MYLENEQINALIARAQKDSKVKQSAAKLYEELINIFARRGYCFIEEEYFAKKFNTTTRTIRRYKKQLKDNGYITAKKGWMISIISLDKIVGSNEQIMSENRKELSENSCPEDTNSIQISDNSIQISDSSIQISDSSILHKQIETKDKQIETKERGDFIALPSHLNPADNLQITQTEFDKLVTLHGKEKVCKELPNFSSWLYDHPRKSKNHYLSLIRWLGKEWARKSIDFTTQQRKGKDDGCRTKGYYDQNIVERRPKGYYDQK